MGEPAKARALHQWFWRRFWCQSNEIEANARLDKERENAAALEVFPDLLKELDKMGPEQRLTALVEGVLAANIFDWGARACVDLYHQGTILEIYRWSRTLSLVATSILNIQEHGPTLNSPVPGCRSPLSGWFPNIRVYDLGFLGLTPAQEPQFGGLSLQGCQDEAVQAALAGRPVRWVCERVVLGACQPLQAGRRPAGHPAAVAVPQGHHVCGQCRQALDPACVHHHLALALQRKKLSTSPAGASSPLGCHSASRQVARLQFCLTYAAFRMARQGCVPPLAGTQQPALSQHSKGSCNCL